MSSYVTGASTIALSSVLSALGILAVGARFYIRKAYRQGFGWDDWLILLALPVVIAQGVYLIIGAEVQAVGYPIADIADDDIVDFNMTFIHQVEFATFFISTIALGLTKLSLVFFYRRIFCTPTNRSFNIFTQVLAGLIAAWTVALTFATIFACGSNVAYQWGSYEDYVDNCANTEILDLFYVASDLLFDLILFILPIPLIFKLKLSPSKRIAITGVFCLGALTVVASIIRTVIFSLLFADLDACFFGNDILMVTSTFFWWTMLEMGLAVIVTCLPTLQIWVRKINLGSVIQKVSSIFSVQSLIRGSRLPSSGATGECRELKDSSDIVKNHATVEMDEYSVSDEENQIQHN